MKRALVILSMLVCCQTAISQAYGDSAPSAQPASDPYPLSSDVEGQHSDTTLGPNIDAETQYKSDAAINSFGNTLPQQIRDKVNFDFLNPLTQCDEKDPVCGYAKAFENSDYLNMEKWAKNPMWTQNPRDEVSMIGLAGMMAIKITNRAISTPEMRTAARKYLAQIADDLEKAGAKLPNDNDIDSKTMILVKDVVPIWLAYSKASG